MANLIKVRHIDPKVDSKLGVGFVTGYTQASGVDDTGKPVTTIYANVSWEKVRSPAVSFHSPVELAWIEIEGVDEEGDLVSNYDLASDEDDVEYVDEEDNNTIEVRA